VLNRNIYQFIADKSQGIFFFLFETNVLLKRFKIDSRLMIVKIDSVKYVKRFPNYLTTSSLSIMSSLL